MPTYQYRCTQCGNDLEAVQKFTDPALTQCPECSGQLRKVFSPVGVVFKGSGFYATDSRSAKTTQASSTDKTDTTEKPKPAASTPKPAETATTTSTTEKKSA